MEIRREPGSAQVSGLRTHSRSLTRPGRLPSTTGRRVLTALSVAFRASFVCRDEQYEERAGRPDADTLPLETSRRAVRAVLRERRPRAERRKPSLARRRCSAHRQRRVESTEAGRVSRVTGWRARPSSRPAPSGGLRPRPVWAPKPAPAHSPRHGTRSRKGAARRAVRRTDRTSHQAEDPDASAAPGSPALRRATDTAHALPQGTRWWNGPAGVIHRRKFGSCGFCEVRVITDSGRPCWPPTRSFGGQEIMQAFLHSDKAYVAAFFLLIIIFAAPTAIAVIRGVEFADLMIVMLFSMALVGLPGAYLMACFAPGRWVRRRPPMVRLPPDPRFLRDPRYPRDSPRARWPLP